MAEMKQQHVVKIKVDTSEVMDAMDQIEKRIDLLTEKMNRLVQTINDCTELTGSEDQSDDSRLITSPQFGHVTLEPTSESVNEISWLQFGHS